MLKSELALDAVEELFVPLADAAELLETGILVLVVGAREARSKFLADERLQAQAGEGLVGKDDLLIRLRCWSWRNTASVGAERLLMYLFLACGVAESIYIPEEAGFEDLFKLRAGMRHLRRQGLQERARVFGLFGRINELFLR